jgi:hypothetical protein
MCQLFIILIFKAKITLSIHTNCDTVKIKGKYSACLDLKHLKKVCSKIGQLFLSLLNP